MNMSTGFRRWRCRRTIGPNRKTALEHSAVQLFVTRLRALDATFVASRENVHLVAAICQHLDGIPLAIEFAAARAATLGVEQVAVGLE